MAAQLPQCQLKPAPLALPSHPARHLRNQAQPVSGSHAQARLCGAQRPAVAAEFALERLGLDTRFYREVGPASDATLASAAPSDYYELLRVEQTAEAAQIKTAYKQLQRLAHPDVAGEVASSTSSLLNEAYTTLSDPARRAAYDAELAQHRQQHEAFTGRPVSSWHGGCKDQALFVDEVSCIGCYQCANFSPAVFEMEPQHGRARVKAQWADDDETIAEAIEMCPVEAISFVRRDQLALLEFVMQQCHREDAAILARRRSGNMGSAPNSNSPFDRARVFMKHRRVAEETLAGKAGARMHDADLAAAIAGAWTRLPADVRARGWPEWVPVEERRPAAAAAACTPQAELGFAPGFRWMETGF